MQSNHPVAVHKPIRAAVESWDNLQGTHYGVIRCHIALKCLTQNIFLPL